ncbi:GntR family transcriptional regulator [Virgibacillus sp. W0430]|uniref:GntR family transcriptional regulator n=1 Tax=Virgibacillus sp. W0430 TaxID=3391580 RepID=UPI003F4477E8
MRIKFDESKPIYMQIKEYIEDSIIDASIQAGERVPSTNEFAKFYKINPATAAKGINELVAENVLVKRRGIGMFVTENARADLMEKRKDQFFTNYILPLSKEAKKLNITEEQLVKMVRRGQRS